MSDASLSMQNGLVKSGKNRMAAQFSAQEAHSRLLGISTMISSLLSKYTINKGSYFSKMAHKATIIVAETNKHLQLFDIGGRSPLLNCLSFLKIGFNSAT